jgi:hypothetical protein
MQEGHDRASEQPPPQIDTGDLQSNTACCQPPHIGMSGARERDVTPTASPLTCAIRSRRTQLPSTMGHAPAASSATVVECGGAPESGQGGDGRRRSKRVAVVVKVREHVRRQQSQGWRPAISSRSHLGRANGSVCALCSVLRGEGDC